MAVGTISNKDSLKAGDVNLYDVRALMADWSINGNRSYQQCSLSVMDTIADPNITFDSAGVCNYYHDYLIAERTRVFKGEEGKSKLSEIVETIKAEGKGKQYDCITGVSGGVDSTYLALQAKKLGLRPLIVHFDNGWNSELAIKNIENIINKLGFDLYTLVVDWEEFKDLQLAYLRASVVDIEAITDHAINGTIYRLANKYGLKYILSGNNIVTEHVLPSHWVFNKSDDLNIKDIHKKFGRRPLKTFPFFSFKERRLYSNVKGMQTIPLLNYLPYNSFEAKETITQELGWRDYGGKHYESVFTKFYQGYILPVKFKIDKRKAHLSNLIFSGQLTKEQAIEMLGKPIYDADELRHDKTFVLKKLELDEEEFDKIMKMPRREHREFRYIKPVLEKYPFLKILRPVWQMLRSKKD
jgi:N-acetyl sugar amidotransferase